MTIKSKIHQVKLFIKISLVVFVLLVFVVLGIFVRPTHTFENSNMKKWLALSEQQRILTLQQVIKDVENVELLINCVTKIAEIPDSNEMMIRDAISLCYNGIKINAQKDKE